MDPKLRIAKNTATMMALKVVMPLLAVVVVLAVSRVLGTEGLGRYTLAFAFLYFFNTMGPLGLHPLITREGARDPGGIERLLSSATTLGTGASLILTAVMASAGAALGYDGETRAALAIMSLALLPCTLGTFFDATFIALERMEYIAVTALTESLIKVGAGVTVLLLGHGLQAVLLAAVVGRAVACLVSVVLLRRAGVAVRWGYDPALMRELTGQAPTFLLISIFATLYWRIDVFMLAQMRPVEDVGLYGAAWRLLEIAIVVPQSLCVALYPQMAGAARHDPQNLARLGRAAARYLFAISLPAAVCTTILAGPMLELLYGDRFVSAANTLTVLMWTVVPYGWVRYHAYVLVAVDQQRIDLRLNALMSVVNVVLNLALIPVYGAMGAAVATLVSVCAYALAQYAYLWRYLPGHAAPVAFESTPFLAAALAGLCVWLVRDTVVLAVAAAPLVYAGTLLFRGFFTPAELRLFRLDSLFGSLGFLSPKIR